MGAPELLDAHNGKARCGENFHQPEVFRECRAPLVDVALGVDRRRLGIDERGLDLIGAVGVGVAIDIQGEGERITACGGVEDQATAFKSVLLGAGGKPQDVRIARGDLKLDFLPCAKRLGDGDGEVALDPRRCGAEEDGVAGAFHHNGIPSSASNGARRNAKSRTASLVLP